MRPLVIALVLLASSPALAGVCISDEELDGYLAQLEATAKSPAAAKDLDGFWQGCLHGNQPRKARIIKACTAIVARLDVDKLPADDNLRGCIPVLAAYGVTPIKTRRRDLDYIGELLAKRYPITDPDTMDKRTLELSGDPRVLPWIIERYREALAATARTPPTGWKAENWLRWRRWALAILQRQGTRAELAFLDEVEAATKDKRVLAWLKSARTAIEKR